MSKQSNNHMFAVSTSCNIISIIIRDKGVPKMCL